MSQTHEFVIEDLYANIDGKPILQGISLRMKSGEVHALMGPNGSGKSTLANVIMGHPLYQVTQGKVLLDGVNILELATDKRAKLGLFLAFQYPVEIPGVTVAKFMKRAVEAKIAAEGGKFLVSGFVKELKESVQFLGMDPQFVNRHLNEGFSGGEKKRMEIVQMLMLKPKFAVLDEADSGLDIDALKVVSDGLNKLRGPEFGSLVITHYQRILNYINPDFVHVMCNGRIVTSGGQELSRELEEKGYDWVKEKFAGGKS
jgi:Fe-S cluster assembly ATP-binding protein